MVQHLVNNYLKALQAADYEAMLSLFVEDAVIISPLYGKCAAVSFYKDLFAATQQSFTTLNEVFTNAPGRKAAFFFNYQWTLADGSICIFDCIDIIELNEWGKITQLQIIYDTALIRTAFERIKR